MSKNYRMIEHTADFGIHVFGRDPADLFANAALALFDLVADSRTLKGANRKEITVTGSDRPDLMVNWLRELLYLWTGNELLVKSIKIQKISTCEVNAVLWYDRYDPGRHVVNNEIKAVTYHQIQVTPYPKGWKARIIFDV
ncbi:MAG: archease [Thermodesulfobacteriota bacterium]